MNGSVQAKMRGQVKKWEETGSACEAATSSIRLKGAICWDEHQVEIKLEK